MSNNSFAGPLLAISSAVYSATFASCNACWAEAKSASVPLANMSFISALKNSNALPAKKPSAAVLAPLPTAVERESPPNKSFPSLRTKPAVAPPAGPPAKAAAVVKRPIKNFVLPGLFLAASAIVSMA